MQNDLFIKEVRLITYVVKNGGPYCVDFSIVRLIGGKKVCTVYIRFSHPSDWKAVWCWVDSVLTRKNELPQLVSLFICGLSRKHSNSLNVSPCLAVIDPFFVHSITTVYKARLRCPYNEMGAEGVHFIFFCALVHSTAKNVRSTRGLLAPSRTVYHIHLSTNTHTTTSPTPPLSLWERATIRRKESFVKPR
jgi:hypothetical protein